MKSLGIIESLALGCWAGILIMGFQAKPDSQIIAIAIMSLAMAVLALAQKRGDK